MFTFHLNPISQNNNQELEEKKQKVRHIIAKLKDATPEDAEVLSAEIRLLCDNDNTFSTEYKRKALIHVRSLECEANMRLADAHLYKASTFRTKEQLTERGNNIIKSRMYYTKACLLGCETMWKRTYLQMAEAIMLNGGFALNTTQCNCAPIAAVQRP